jgi:hypothetical protein
LATRRDDDRCLRDLRRTARSRIPSRNGHSRGRCERGRHPARRRKLTSVAGDRRPQGNGVSRVGLKAIACALAPSWDACQTRGGLRLQGSAKCQSRARPPWRGDRLLSEAIEPLHRGPPSGGSAGPLRPPWRLGRLRRDARSQAQLASAAALPRPHRSERVGPRRQPWTTASARRRSCSRRWSGRLVASLKRHH